MPFFFFSEINNIVAGAIRSIAWVAFFSPLKPLRFSYGLERRKISVLPKKRKKVGQNNGHAM